METMKTIQQLLKIHAMLLCAALTVVSCADDNLTDDKEEGDKGTAVSFHVSSAQDEMLLQQQTAPATRSAVLSRLGDEGLTLEDLATRKHAVQGTGDLCMIETTIEGVNPVLPSADTRAKVKTNIDNFFTTSGYRSDTPGFAPDTPDWFYAVKTKNDGTLTTYHPWHWGYRYGRFYAVYPEAKSENKITLSPATHSGTPYVEFEAEQDVKNQKDLMTACSGEVKYETRGIAPTTNLKFRHALTAVRFAVGQNLSWNKRITKVEIKNACSKGKYMLPTQYGGAGTWVAGSLTDRKDFVLDVTASPIDLRKNPNTVIMGNPSDNYTFYMIPQDLTGVSVVVTLEDNDPAHPSPAPNTITIPLTGKKAWKPGTSKLYKLSQNTSDWTFHLTVTQPSAAAYDATQTGYYGISSYREAPDGTQRPVAWKVVKYQESTDGGATWSAESDTKPAWLTGLSLTQGNGSTAAQQGSATVQKAHTTIDKLAPYNKVLHDATPKGSPTSYYDLSTHDYKGNATARNTANSYLISAPGYYKIPLVYGNAIKNGSNNPSSYTSSAPPVIYYGSDIILHHFKDHAGVDINNPWITQTNSGANAPDGAKIVWTDQSGIVEASSLGIEGSGANAFVHFHVPQDKIKNGNAVIAVTKGGTVVWSWHLWFDHDDVLDILPPITNFQGVNYKFTKQTLGFAYRKWESTTYDKPRVARVKVEQIPANGGVRQFGYIDITQNPGSVKEFHSTHYQFGRKDAIPGTDAIADGSFNKNAGNNMSIQNGIQHPENFYTWGSSWTSYPPAGYSYYNLWSMDNTTIGYNDNAVVKTIYNPCPVGLKVPASNAFTGFTPGGQNSGTPNIEGSWDMGYTFKSKTGTNTVFFPASGWRYYNDGLLHDVGERGFYWSAVPYMAASGCCFAFYPGFTSPMNRFQPPFGMAVRPVAE